MICRFAYVDYTITNRNIKNTNIAMVKPHIVKIKVIDYLIFDECDVIFINGYKDNISLDKYGVAIYINPLYINEEMCQMIAKLLKSIATLLILLIFLMVI